MAALKLVDQIATEEDLIKAFRPRDQKHVILERTMRFPLAVGPYLAWSEPSGVRIYLVFKRPEWKAPIGVAFRRDQTGSINSATGVCEWCANYGPSDRVGLLTATVDSRRRIGVNLCLDLSCSQHLENFAQVSGGDIGKMIAGLHAKMARFCDEGLGLRGA